MVTNTICVPFSKTERKIMTATNQGKCRQTSKLIPHSSFILFSSTVWRIPALKSWHKGTNAHSLGDSVLDEEKIRQATDRDECFDMLIGCQEANLAHKNLFHFPLWFFSRSSKENRSQYWVLLTSVTPADFQHDHYRETVRCIKQLTSWLSATCVHSGKEATTHATAELPANPYYEPFLLHLLHGYLRKLAYKIMIIIQHKDTG